MKKIVWGIVILLLLPLVTSISTNMRDSYQPGETAVVQIFGNILEPIFPADVQFLRDGHVEVPFDYDLKKIDENYYLYFVNPSLELGENESQEYTIRIKGVLTTVQGQQQEIDFEQSFSVEGDLIDYTVRPGIVYTSENFELQVVLNRDLNQEIFVSFPWERDVILRPGENRINFNIEDVSGGLYQVVVGNYTLPVYILKEIDEPKPLIYFYPSRIESSIFIGSEPKYSFVLRNTGGEPIEDFSVFYNEDIVRIDPGFPKKLEPGEEYNFDLFLESDSEEISESIVIEYGNESFEFPIFVEYTEEKGDIVIPNSSDGTIVEVDYYCSELEGERCSSNEICVGDLVSSRDVKECCIGTCTPSQEGTSLAWVGYVIGFLLLVILIIVGLRYFKAKKQKDDVFKEKVGKAERKVLPTF